MTVCVVGRYAPISPPLSFVIATTAGRGGIPGWKSGQRVVGLSNVEPASSRGAGQRRTAYGRRV
jgi:hypothetical protein